MTGGHGAAVPGGRRGRPLPPGPALLFAGALAVFAVAGLYGPAVKTLVAGLFLVAIVTRRLGGFVRDWALFLAGLALFDSLRAGVFTAVNSLGLPLYMGYVIRLERALFGGETLPTLLQAAWLSPGAPGVLERLLVAVHASHFVIFLLFGLGLWLLRGEAFGRFAGAMLLVMHLGILGYLAAPTVPPWMAADFQAIPAIQRPADDVYGAFVPGLRRALDTNPVAAMPSLHAAFPALCALVGIRHFGAWGWLLGAYVALVSLAAAALGEHYFLDLLAGVLLAAAAYRLRYRRAGGTRADGREPVGPAAGGRPGGGRGLVLAAVLLLLAAGVSQAALRYRRPFAVTEAFVRRELDGRTDVAALAQGLVAYRTRDFDAARQTLQRALPDVREPTPLLTRAHELLALAHFQLGAFAEGERVLIALAARQPDDPTALYWLTRYRYERQGLSPDDVRAAIAKLDAHPDRARAGRFARRLASMLAGTEARAAW